MGLKRYSKSYRRCSPVNKIPDSWILDLPDSWSEMKETPPLSLPEIIALCEKMLPIWNAERFSKPPPPPLAEPFTLFPSPKPHIEDGGDER